VVARPSEAKRAAFDAICELLAPGDAKVIADVHLALNDRDGYAKKFKTRLDERGGLAVDDRRFYWIALIDALEARGKLSERDWKDEPSDTRWAIDKILGKKASRWAWCADGSFDEVATDLFLRAAGKALASDGLALVALDMGADNYPIAVAPFDRIKELRALAKQAGGKIDSFAPKTRPKARPAARPPAANAKFSKFEIDNAFYDLFSHERGVVVFEDKKPLRPVSLLDVSTWPPKVVPLEDDYVSNIAWSVTGDRVACVTYANEPSRTKLVVHRAGGHALDLAPKLPKQVDVERIALDGDGILFLPPNTTYRGRSVSRPLYWHPGDFAFHEIDNLPKVVVPPSPNEDPKDGTWTFAAQGIARTGDGATVLLWNDQGWVRDGERFTARFSIGACGPYDKLPSAPARGDGFFFETQGKLFEARAGKDPVRRLPKQEKICWLAPGPEGSLIATIVRHSIREPLALVLFPDSGEYLEMSAPQLGFLGSDFASFGVRWCEARSAFWTVDLPFELRTLDGSHVLGGPRKREA
jgi:hypothetical protein